MSAAVSPAPFDRSLRNGNRSNTSKSLVSRRIHKIQGLTSAANLEYFEEHWIIWENLVFLSFEKEMKMSLETLPCKTSLCWRKR